jgi:hypothetical protein
MVLLTIAQDMTQRGSSMRNKNWTKRYAECIICRDDIDITVCGWVYAGEPEQRYERHGQPPHPGSDPTVDIVSSLIDGEEVELAGFEIVEAEEKLIEAAYEDTDE